jgi:hypothetical protein
MPKRMNVRRLIRARVVGLSKQEFRTPHSLDYLHHLAPRLVSLFEYHLTLRHVKYLSQERHQGGISGPFHRRRCKPDFQCVAM